MTCRTAHEQVLADLASAAPQPPCRTTNPTMTKESA